MIFLQGGILMTKNINLQDVFLNQVRKEHIPVTVPYQWIPAKRHGQGF